MLLDRSRLSAVAKRGIIALRYDTGLQVDELVAADVDMLREGNITLQVPTEISKVAEEAGGEPYLLDGTRGEPGHVTPYALRHSVAYRMMNAEEGNTLYNIRNHMRHRSIQTTEQVYDHLIRV